MKDNIRIRNHRGPLYNNLTKKNHINFILHNRRQGYIEGSFGTEYGIVHVIAGSDYTVFHFIREGIHYSQRIEKGWPFGHTLKLAKKFATNVHEDSLDWIDV